jgi:hypothetical protein
LRTTALPSRRPVEMPTRSWSRPLGTKRTTISRPERVRPWDPMRSKSRRERRAGTAPGRGRRSGGELSAATCAPSGEHPAAALRLHARTEAVLLGAMALLRLVRSLGHWASEAPLGERSRAFVPARPCGWDDAGPGSLTSEDPEHGAAAPPARGSYTTPPRATPLAVEHGRGGGERGLRDPPRRVACGRSERRWLILPGSIAGPRCSGPKVGANVCRPGTGDASGKPTASDRRSAVEEGQRVAWKSSCGSGTGVASARGRAGSEGTTAAGTAAIDGREAGVARRTR